MSCPRNDVRPSATAFASARPSVDFPAFGFPASTVTAPRAMYPFQTHGGSGGNACLEFRGRKEADRRLGAPRHPRMGSSLRLRQLGLHLSRRRSSLGLVVPTDFVDRTARPRTSDRKQQLVTTACGRNSFATCEVAPRLREHDLAYERAPTIPTHDDRSWAVLADSNYGHDDTCSLWPYWAITSCFEPALQVAPYGRSPRGSWFTTVCSRRPPTGASRPSIAPRDSCSMLP